MNADIRLRGQSQKIGALLRSYCKIKNLSQRDVAEIIGKEVSYVNKILKGDANLALRTIAEIESALGVGLVNVETRLVPLMVETTTAKKADAELYSYALAC